MPDLCPQFSLAWSLAQRRLRTEEPHPLGQELLRHSRRQSLQDTLGSSPCQSPSAAPTAAHLFKGVQGSKKWETVKELRFCNPCALPAIGARTYVSLRSSGIWDWATWAFCQVCFYCPGFQHTGLVTSTVLDFLHLQLPPHELSPSWASALHGLHLTGAKLRLFQPS